MLRLKLILPITLLISTSCTSSEDISEAFESQMESAKTTGLVSTRYITSHEADSIAIAALTNFYTGDNKSRSVRNLTPKQTYIYETSKSRSINNDTTFYVVNVAPEGFALVAADRRIKEPIYAFSDKGSFDDSSENPGLKLYLEIMKADIKAATANADSLPDLPIGPENPPHSGGFQPVDPSELAIVEIDGIKYYASSSNKHENVDTMLVTKWGQGTPFNRYCLDKNGNPRLAGCVAVALSQILSYHRIQFPGHTYDWDTMLDLPGDGLLSDQAKEDIAHLIYTVGTKAKINYHEDSKSDIFKARDCLKDIGFKNVKILESWEESILTSIKNHGPIYMRAKDNKDGHAWVVDGYHRDITTTNYFTLDKMYYATSVVDTKFLHINWGWKGAGNAYYRQCSSYEPSGYKFNKDIMYIINITK